MLTIQLPDTETYDAETNQFTYHKGMTARFEYSLIAILEWESRWKKPFLNSEMSYEESKDFYRCMALDPIDDKFITPDVMKEISTYINNPNTATTFSNHGSSNTGGPGKGKKYTAEEFYASMFSAGIPLEFERRNFNTLLVILKVISHANEPPKKMSQQDILSQNAAINAQRKAMYKTKG